MHGMSYLTSAISGKKHLNVFQNSTRANNKNTKCFGLSLMRISNSLCFSLYKVNVWDRFREKGPSAYYKICYKNALRLNRYSFRTVNAIDFLFSSLHNTPFLYVDLYFRVLHKLRVDVMST